MREEASGHPEVKLAMVSTLFNSPSSGGGIADTVGLGQALQRAGVEIFHVYARNPRWPTGQVEGEAPLPGLAVDFERPVDLAPRLRAAVDAKKPDAVLVTDSWCTKAPIALAFTDYPLFLRLHAYELICPANNMRLLPGPNGFRDCPNNALLTPGSCRECVRTYTTSGAGLRASEAVVAGAAGEAFYAQIHQALSAARAVFVYNTLAVKWLGEYGQKAIVAGSGVDPERFESVTPAPRGDKPIVFMAGGVEDPIKGYAVLLEACGVLWRDGLDFELWATAREPSIVAGGRVRFTGWLGSQELAAHFLAADICVVPSVWHEAFGIVAVEAMAAGKPLVASRAGGLQETVVEGETGILFDRADSAALANAIRTLLGDEALRQRMGATGRRRFLERYTWDAVVEKAYLPALHAAE